MRWFAWFTCRCVDVGSEGLQTGILVEASDCMNIQARGVVVVV